ncbi:stage V sporulation T C-terminal domain-containing protein, partial [Clostridium haemolyticum]
AEGDAIGAVIIASKEDDVSFGDVEVKLAEAAASFLGKQME